MVSPSYIDRTFLDNVSSSVDSRRPFTDPAFETTVAVVGGVFSFCLRAGTTRACAFVPSEPFFARFPPSSMLPRFENAIWSNELTSKSPPEGMSIEMRRLCSGVMPLSVGMCGGGGGGFTDFMLFTFLSREAVDGLGDDPSWPADFGGRMDFEAVVGVVEAFSSSVATVLLPTVEVVGARPESRRWSFQKLDRGLRPGDGPFGDGEGEVFGRYKVRRRARFCGVVGVRGGMMATVMGALAVTVCSYLTA